MVCWSCIKVSVFGNMLIYFCTTYAGKLTRDLAVPTLLFHRCHAFSQKSKLLSRGPWTLAPVVTIGFLCVMSHYHNRGMCLQVHSGHLTLPCNLTYVTLAK